MTTESSPKNMSAKSNLRLLLASLIPLVAFILQWSFWTAIQPFVWFLFFPT